MSYNVKISKSRWLDWFSSRLLWVPENRPNYNDNNKYLFSSVEIHTCNYNTILNKNHVNILEMTNKIKK